jgi:serine/threonine protein kinase
VRYLAESKRTRWKVKRAAQKHRSPNDLHKQFLPSADISQLVGRRAVCLELFKATNKVSGIRNPESYEKILAILYLMKQPELLTVFVDNGACDAHLPFDYQEIKEDDRRLVLRSRNAPNPRTVHLSEEANVREFAALQWCVLAHVFALPFEMDVPHYQLGESVILPFKKLRRVSYGGCSGTVYKAKIHPDYHSWNEVSVCFQRTARPRGLTRCNVFAIKVLLSGEPAIFPQEIRILEKFQKESHHHKHIVDLLATFEQYGMYHLVFPWAKFNLFQYWEDHPSPEKSVDAADWLMKQCHGLVEALHNIHRYKTRSGGILLQMSTETRDSNRANTLDDNDGPQLNKWFFGRHGDLKPENILWYPIEGSRYGILKIADFGSTRFSEEKTKYGIVPNSMTYQSPEFNLRGRFGIACDIWALGCVYLLFATWYFGGMKAIDKFGKDRLQPDKTLDMNVDMFFTLDDSEQPPKAFVKLAVQKVSSVTMQRRLVTDCHRKSLIYEHFSQIRQRSECSLRH